MPESASSRRGRELSRGVDTHCRFHIDDEHDTPGVGHDTDMIDTLGQELSNPTCLDDLHLDKKWTLGKRNAQLNRTQISLIHILCYWIVGVVSLKPRPVTRAIFPNVRPTPVI